MAKSSIDPRLARLAQTAAERLRLDVSLGHTHFVPTRVAEDAVLPPRETPTDPWQDGSANVQEEAAALAPSSDTESGASESTPPIADTGSAAKLEAIRPVREEAWRCTKCGLCKTRTNVVFGQGSLDTGLVFVGEAPGADEDAQGLPFVGRAGEVLTLMIEKGFKRPRESVYICNILKCRPPGNRTPHPDEMALCMPYLKQQLAIIQPKVICALGRTAATALLGCDESLGRLRGQWHDVDGIPMIPTYHPAYLLRKRGPNNERSEDDRKTWEDMKMIIERLQG